MKIMIRSYQMFLSQLMKDGVMFLMLFTPFLAAIAFRFGVPFLEHLLTDHFNLESIISPYYRLIDLFLVSMTAYMFCFAVAMTMLDEYDENVIEHLIITPIKKGGYLISRLGFSMGMAFLFSVVIFTAFALESWAWPMKVFLSLMSSFLGLIIALIVFSFSSNKVEGLAIAKMAGLVLSGFMVPFFVDHYLGFVFMVLPSYWIAVFALEVTWISFVMVLAVMLVWLWALMKRFNKKLST